MAKKHSKPAVVRPQFETAKRKPPKFTLDEAFYYDPGDTVGGIAKGILAISHLLVSISEHGNEPIEGWIAYGLALALQRYVDDVTFYLAPKAAELRRG